MTVSIKTPQEIEKMRIAGRLASEVLDYITPFVAAGITTEELDVLCHNYMVDVQKTIPAPLNYAPSGHS
ncbi:MAG: type I methionyl aminopeptidase, partial [Pseudomonadota bacterium]